MPPSLRTTAGEERCVGIELEFSGVPLETTAQLIATLYRGKVTENSTYEFKIETDDYGAFTVEIDSSVLKKKKYENFLLSLGLDKTVLNRSTLEEVLKSVAAWVLPYEITTPPIPLSRLYTIELLQQKLGEAGAEGTDSSFLNAFGLHFNIQVAEPTVEYIHDMTAAFVVLQENIRKYEAVNLTRKVSSYLGYYSADYNLLLTDSSYKPTLEQFAKDYVHHVGTRNKDLDLLPLLAFYCGQKILDNVTSAELVGTRPAFHYRLPNSLPNHPEWRISESWNRWVQVETLCDDKKRLAKLKRMYQLKYIQ